MNDVTDPDRRPSGRRRLLAITSLATLTIALLLIAGELLTSPILLVGGLGGLAILTGSAWWAVTERAWRRWVGIIGMGVGTVVMALAFRLARADDDAAVSRLGLLIVVLAISVASARAALVRDLHDMDRHPRFRPQRPVLICNPRSGGGKVARFDLIAAAQAMGVEVLVLQPGMDLAELARDAIARGADCLGMAGGDGSQALVAAIAIEHDVPFVVISAGTRNHFALDLGLDRDDPRTGMAAFDDGVLRRVDFATVGDRLFVNNVSLGIYASIVEEEGYRDAKVETSLSRLPELLGRQAEPFDLQFTTPDGGQVTGAFVVLVSNNPYVMGPALDLSQRRVMDSGELGVFAVTASTGTEAAALVTRAIAGLGRRDPHLHDFATPTFEIRSHGGSVWAGIDGESVRLDTPLRFTSHHKGLRLLVPAASIRAAERRRARGLHVGALVRIARGLAPQTNAIEAFAEEP